VGVQSDVDTARVALQTGAAACNGCSAVVIRELKARELFNNAGIAGREAKRKAGETDIRRIFWEKQSSVTGDGVWVWVHFWNWL
jgi:hypothetical protein